MGQPHGLPLPCRYIPPMTATLEPERKAPDLDEFEHHWQDEADAAFLYRKLATAESDPRKRDLYLRLAEVEDRHVTIWTEILTRNGRPPQPFRPTARARMLAVLGRTLGPRLLLPTLLAEEGREVRGYLNMHRGTPAGGEGKEEALILARESAEHATTLGGMAGRTGEPWHRTESGGFLRNVVYGFNDGLTANFGLVAGMIGATAAQAHETIVLAGVAGLIADALSMGSSGYLAAKSEREVYEPTEIRGVSAVPCTFARTRRRRLRRRAGAVRTVMRAYRPFGPRTRPGNECPCPCRAPAGAACG